MRLRMMFCVMVLGLSAVFAVADEKPEAPEGAQPKKIAILANIWTNKCHANLIATRFFTGFPIDTGLVKPKVEVASIYVTERRDNDVAGALSKKFGVPIYPTITDALTMGGEELAVDGVLYIGQHGKYQRSRFGQRMYPHLNDLEEVFRVFESSGRSVPVYNDKELAYSWIDAKWICDRAKELDVPLMAGSVIPVSYRTPMLEHPIGANITEAVSIGYGNMTAYAFHALEILQCMVERRAGGETGVRSVQCIEGPAVYEAAKEGKFSMELAEVACAAAKGKKGASMETTDKKPTLILINYLDGTKGAVIIATRYVGEHWGYAAIADGKTVTCSFPTPPTPIYSYFSYMGLNIEKMFLTGEVQIPVERTLLTTGILDMAVRSRAGGGKEIETPFLHIQYKPFDFDPIWPRSTAPKGASIGPWPPKGFEFIVPGGSGSSPPRTSRIGKPAGRQKKLDSTK